MVTTNVGGVAAMAGQESAAQGVAGNRGENAGFAQLLEGMESENTQMPAIADVEDGCSNQTDDAAGIDAATVDQTALSADVLAWCGMAATAAAPGAAESGTGPAIAGHPAAQTPSLLNQATTMAGAAAATNPQEQGVADQLPTTGSVPPSFDMSASPSKAHAASNQAPAIDLLVPFQDGGIGPAQLDGDAGVLEAAPRHHLHARVGTHQWAAELGNKLTLLAGRDVQSATLYMTPADLGPVQVRIDMHQDQASVWFTAEHPETRSALEQSLPRLREMFVAQGMSLTDAGVFGDRSRQGPDTGTTVNQPADGHYASDDFLEDTSMVRSISLGLLDAYA